MKRILLIAGLCLSLPVAAACWRSVTTPGTVRFVAEQSGAPMEGQFTRYTATLCLPDAGQTGSIDAELDTDSVDSGLPELDTEMRGPLFFDVKKWPKAHLSSKALSRQGDGSYQATATLSVRDKSRPITVQFQFKPGADSAQLETAFEIQRLDYDIGTGEWSATDWVANKVKVEIKATLKPDAAGATH